MRNKISQLWHQHPFRVVSVILIIITGIVVPIVINGCPPPGFTITVYPLTQMVEQGGFISTTITVKSEHGYAETVSLSASGQPAGVVVSFVPPIGGGEPAFTSNVNIAAHLNASVGRHEITITGVGADGMEHSVKYSLTVILGDPVIPGDLDKPPTAVVSATPTTIEEGESVPFSGVDSTDPDGTIETYAVEVIWLRLPSRIMMVYLTLPLSGSSSVHLLSLKSHLSRAETKFHYLLQ